jgi:hypothetical protein
MAKVFLLPDGFEAPEFDWQNIEKYQKDCAEHTAKLKEWCLNRNPSQKNVGEVIKFQVADGYAEYMVAAIKPVQLLHLPYMDAYQSETAPLMTAKAIQDKIDQARAMEKLFNKKV